MQTALAIGARRNVSHINILDFGSTVMADVAKDSIIRSELAAGNMMQSYAFTWHAMRETEVK